MKRLSPSLTNLSGFEILFLIEGGSEVRSIHRTNTQFGNGYLTGKPISDER
jgi:hypothetical protein